MFRILRCPSSVQGYLQICLSIDKTSVSCLCSGAPLLGKFGNLSIREILVLGKFGNLSIREILVVTSAPARTDSGEGGVESQDNPTGGGGGGGGEYHLFLAGNRGVLMGNRRFSWREIGRQPSLLKKRVFLSATATKISILLTEIFGLEVNV